MSIRSGIESGVKVANDYADITNIRNTIYKTKREILYSPLVKELISLTFTSNIPPSRIQINSDGIFAQIYDNESNTYHPTGVHLYAPDVAFNYVFSAALGSIFQDIFPDIYETNKIYISQLPDMIEKDTWFCELTIKSEYMYKVLSPAFDFSKINEIPLNSPLFKMSDKYTSKAPMLPKISFILGIAGIILCFTQLIGTFLSFCGVFTGIVGFRSAPKSKRSLAVWGIILSVIGLLLPMVIGFLSFKSFLGI